MGTVEESVVGRPLSVTVKNPVGAGDSMLAALVVAHLRGWGLYEAVRWCIAAGTASAMQEGTSVATLAQIESLLGHVEVERSVAVGRGRVGKDKSCLLENTVSDWKRSLIQIRLGVRRFA